MSERMFSLSSPVAGRVVLNWSRNPFGDLLSYAAAYKNAARALVAPLDAVLGCHPDHRALPILFLYRHATELYLKTMVYWTAKAARASPHENGLQQLWRTHSISELLSMVSALSVRMPNPRQLISVENEALLAEFNQLDVGSDAFRYPVTPRGQASLPDTLVLNVLAIAEQMDCVLDDLSLSCISLAKSYKMRHRD